MFVRQIWKRWTLPAAAVAAAVAAVLFSGCSGESINDAMTPSWAGDNTVVVDPPATAVKDSFIDININGQNKTYKTVKIGAQWWMAENLDYQIGNSWCYDDDISYCNTYGRLYDWNTAMTACPSGWHLPTIYEWDTVLQHSPLGLDSYYGFGSLALTGVNRDTDGNFLYVYSSNIGIWWSATGSSDGTYASAGLMGGGSVGFGSYEKGYAFYVRCVGDDGETHPAAPPPIYAVTVSSAGTGAGGGGTYAAGATVSINAGTAPAGHPFNNWTSSGNVSLANANNAATTFVMPSNAVTVTADFKPITGGTNCTSAANCGAKEMPDWKIWMTENLNIATSNGLWSWCYENNPDNCAKYGRLYTWEAAKSACPTGWRLPSREEWQRLLDYTGGAGEAGKRLKSASGWDASVYYSNENGTDQYGFSALPGGGTGYASNVDSLGAAFSSAGYMGFWWTATAYTENFSKGYAWYRSMGSGYNYKEVFENTQSVNQGYSVRCVGDGGVTPPLYTVTVSNAGTDAIGDGRYTAGTKVRINAGTPPKGQSFKNWTTSSGGVTFANPNSATTMFTMPENAVTVTANYQPGSDVAGGTNCTSGASCKSRQMPDGKIWMTENLNIQTKDSWCYNYTADSCAKYGRLYSWEAANSACPAGWHLPLHDEWNNLLAAAGGKNAAGNKLKSQTGWYNNNDGTNGNGTDSYGFSALPGGHFAGRVEFSDGSVLNDVFWDAGSSGYWWTATGLVWFNNGWEGVSVEYGVFGGGGYSVRCIAD